MTDGLKTLVKLNIKKDRCKGCAYCVQFCPKGVLRLSETLNSRGIHCVEISNIDKCTGCGICALMCPDVCMEIYK
jgi:2-oxoglutarate ferredoxin oxidoreductase subunit delta